MAETGQMDSTKGTHCLGETQGLGESNSFSVAHLQYVTFFSAPLAFRAQFP